MLAESSNMIALSPRKQEALQRKDTHLLLSAFHALLTADHELQMRQMTRSSLQKGANLVGHGLVATLAIRFRVICRSVCSCRIARFHLAFFRHARQQCALA